MIKKIFIALLFATCMLIVHINVNAKVTGKCANCHTMHNSQNGSAMARQLNSSYTGFENDTTPNAALLISDCLGCHSSTDSNEDISSVGAPIVFSTSGPQFGFDDGTYKHGLAGGNFYWVRTEDTKGHNVFSDNPDNNLNEAPGKTGGCNGSNSCHIELHNSTNPNQFGFTSQRQGCTKCHMISNSDAPQGFHHLDDTGPIIDSDAEGWYRFLTGHNNNEGASGIEDSDWQSSYDADDHNEYRGYSGNKSAYGGFSALADTMTAYCTGCHGEFHEQDTTVIGASPWIRHPSDSVIPDSGEYSAYTTYDPQAPVARPVLSAIGDSSQVRPGTDMVMCLSCHRPHGSPYPDMLRWNYNNMVAGGSGSGGCFTCHTQKNQTP